MDVNTGTQLRLIRDINGAFAGAGIQWWLYGGWAIDAHLGKVLRDHSDIEVVIRLDDAATAREALAAAGFKSLPEARSEEGEDLMREGQRLELLYIVQSEEGEVITPGFADWPWIPRSFDGPPGRLDGLSLPVVSVESLLDVKEGFAKHRHGQPLREKDIADIDRLKRLLRER